MQVRHGETGGPDEGGSPDAWAARVEAQMTDEERFSLLRSVMGRLPGMDRDPRVPEDVPLAAGHVPGVERLGVPPMTMSDAGLGVTNPDFREGDTATALPASIALAASFDPALARRSGAVVGREARSRGFTVQLAGGANLVRDPRNGRNFEYLSEDPLLTARMAAASVDGIQSEGVVSTVKHFSLNCNETNRQWLDAVIDPDAHRESDLLAFELAIEESAPGAVMAAYNKVNGTYAAGDAYLLTDLLKGEWGYPGWVMSDWGGTPDWSFAPAGLDQESGAQIDAWVWSGEAFGEPLREALDRGELPRERLADMVRRILRSIRAVGVDRRGAGPEVDLDAHADVALDTARRGIVLLKNEGDVLPLGQDPQTVAVIGGNALVGVPAGCGSSLVTPTGGFAATLPLGGPGIMGSVRTLSLLPSSPLAELRTVLPEATIEYDPGMSPASAALLAARCDVAVVFAHDVSSEGYDSADLALPWGQDALVEAVAAANPRTVVVLETGNPVTMPWIDKVPAVVEAWYPGQRGGCAIAEVLAGVVEPSGRLPVTFPVGLEQHPRPELPDAGAPWGTPTTIRYDEGAEVGYRWYARTGQTPLFPFGHGLGYTSFAVGDLEVSGDETLRASVSVTNTGGRPGSTVAQVYLTDVDGEPRQRLLGFERVELQPGESCRVVVTADPRVFARDDGVRSRWVVDGGRYRVAAGFSATDLPLAAVVELEGRSF